MYLDIAKADPANLAAWDAAIELWCRKSTNVGECMGVLDLELKLLGNVELHKEALSEVLELRARARTEQGLIDAALADLDRAERALRTRSTVFSARARALLKASRRDEALEALKHARELDPKNEEVDELSKVLSGAHAPEKPKSDEDRFGGQ
jgi:tetratricopeptide (TPR) repeat protein